MEYLLEQLLVCPTKIHVRMVIGTCHAMPLHT
uniref:Uncharacterized protein n=1 Tax=Arundo donax TaxID=35708 RepID=A0A0A9C3U7_ARUDO